MKTRIISALMLVPLLLFVFWGGIPLLAICFVFSAAALYEFYNGFKNIDIHPDFILGLISLVCLYAIIIWGEFIHGNSEIVYAHLLCLWVFGTVTAGLLIGLFKKGMPVIDGLFTSIGDLYICFFIAHIPLITRIVYYDKLVWLVFIASLGSDVCAYFSGLAFGKHKLCPDISPKKTIEGSIGGMIGSGVLCAIFGLIIYQDIVVHCIIIGVFGGAFSQCGDLIASMFKRKMEIKDFGTLIPGHGGVLDRFDSTLLIAPFIYYYILVVLRPTGFVSLFYL